MGKALNALICFSDADERYGREYGVFRPRLHVPAKNNIEGFDFNLGLQGDLVNHNVLDQELRWHFQDWGYAFQASVVLKVGPGFASGIPPFISS